MMIERGVKSFNVLLLLENCKITQVSQNTDTDKFICISCEVENPKKESEAILSITSKKSYKILKESEDG